MTSGGRGSWNDINNVTYYSKAALGDIWKARHKAYVQIIYCHQNLQPSTFISFQHDMFLECIQTSLLTLTTRLWTKFYLNVIKNDVENWITRKVEENSQNWAQGNKKNCITVKDNFLWKTFNIKNLFIFRFKSPRVTSSLAPYHSRGYDF